MTPKIIFILFVNLRKDSPAYILIYSKEQLDYIHKKLTALIFFHLWQKTLTTSINWTKEFLSHGYICHYDTEMSSKIVAAPAGQQWQKYII